ncbi:hypothetical protein K502DRAFT_352628 [Neoconidiobolus thromboides FSU 785]|nr:hypothetical protein K502DRAFT_352628 [Neoconidiobolus thromboides FSU 785]
MHLNSLQSILFLYLLTHITSITLLDDAGDIISPDIQAIEDLLMNIKPTIEPTKTIYISYPSPTPTQNNRVLKQEEDVLVITSKSIISSKTSTNTTKVEGGKEHSHNKDGNKETEDSEEAENIRSKDPIGASTMFVVGLITTSLNFVACGYLLYLVNKLRKRVGFHSSLRILTYSVLNDILVGGFFTFSIVYSTLFDTLVSGNSCQFIGFIINTLEATDMLLIGFIAISTALKATKGYELKTGKYDWFLLFIIIGLPLIATTILAQFHAFGPEEFWCLIDDETLAGKISTIALLFLYLVIAILILGGYMLVRTYKHDHHNNKNHSTETLSTLESEMLKDPSLNKKFYHQIYRKSIMTLDYAEIKLETHLLIHFFQYTPPTVHLLLMLFDYRESWVFTLAILSTNLSGVFQLIAYLHHQKKKKLQFKELHKNTLRKLKSPERHGILTKFELTESISPKGDNVKLRNASHFEPSPIKDGSHSTISFALPNLKYQDNASLYSNQTLLSIISPPKSSYDKKDLK